MTFRINKQIQTIFLNTKKSGVHDLAFEECGRSNYPVFLLPTDQLGGLRVTSQLSRSRTNGVIEEKSKKRNSHTPRFLFRRQKATLLLFPSQFSKSSIPNIQLEPRNVVSLNQINSIQPKLNIFPHPSIPMESILKFSSISPTFVLNSPFLPYMLSSSTRTPTGDPSVAKFRRCIAQRKLSRSLRPASLPSSAANAAATSNSQPVSEPLLFVV